MATSKKTMGSSDTRKELLTAIDGLAKRGGMTRDKALAAWYASTLLGIEEDEAIDAASVDGPGDNGCDLIYVDDEQAQVIVLQGYVSDRVERATPVKKWNALTASIGSVKDPESFQHGGRADIYERLKDVNLDDYSLVFGVVSVSGHNDEIGRHVEAARRSKAYGSNTTFFYESQDSLYDKYVVAKAAGRSVDTDTITFSNGVIQLKGEFGQAVVGSVRASELNRLYTQHRNKLFEGNVRLFVGQRKGGINEKIIETAEQKPGVFWALNNGITIVADSYEGLSESRYRLNQFSIVNGCQTTVSLCKAIERSAAAEQSEVMVRIVGARKALLTEIVRYNNTQNPVKLSAVRLLDPIQESLRSKLTPYGYTYAPKQEGAKLQRSSTKIDLERITQYLAALSDDTILEAVAKKADLYDKSYKTIFPRGTTAERVLLVWLLALKIEEERMKMLEQIGDSDPIMSAILGIHGTPWGIYVAGQLIERGANDLSRLTLQKITTPEFGAAVGKYAKKAMDLYTELAVNILSVEEDDSNPRNRMRIRSFLDKLKRQLQLRTTKFASFKLPKLHGVG
ncbi:MULTISPECIES: AIPR family protein [unclassified Cupriavidus]|uniref:AIPR family protein n=1 Tax=Cupriavidus sp. H19C3 TaxID=3241603 RepID=UPI003BF88271